MIELNAAKAQIEGITHEVLRRYRDPDKRKAAADVLAGAVTERAAFLNTKLAEQDKEWKREQAEAKAAAKAGGKAVEKAEKDAAKRRADEQAAREAEAKAAAKAGGKAP